MLRFHLPLLGTPQDELTEPIRTMSIHKTIKHGIDWYFNGEYVGSLFFKDADEQEHFWKLAEAHVAEHNKDKKRGGPS